MPYTLILSHSSRAVAMVNQPVLSQEWEILLKDMQDVQEPLLTSPRK